MKEISNKINEWHKKAFPECTVESIMDKVKEEYSEFVLSVGQGKKDDISDEIADCFIVLISAARILGVDIEMAINDKFERVKEKYRVI
jgi:NTP pyrophosphatase (non-canonical NTP hydrolase)